MSTYASLGLLGRQLFAALFFARDNFNLDMEVQCDVRGEQITAEEMFEMGDQNCFFMRSSSLPGDITIYAIGIDSKNLLLETAEIQMDEAVEALVPFGVEVKRDGITKQGKQKVRFKYPSEVQRVKGVRNRMLWVIPSNTDEVEDLIRIPDFLDANDLFVREDEDDGADGPAAGGGLAVVQDLRLAQQLAVMQKPILSLAMTVSTTMRMELSPELRQMFAMEQRLRRMTETEIEALILENPTPEFQNHLYRAAIFGLARNLKEVAAARGRSISWREARAMARRIVARQARVKPE